VKTLFLFFATVSFALANADPVKVTAKEVEQAIHFFTGKEKPKAFPLQISGSSLYRYTFTSSRHLVHPRGGDESMLSFWLKNQSKITFFKFTITPALTLEESASLKQLDLATLLKDRKVVEYRIKEIDQGGSIEKHKDLIIFSKGRIIKKV